MVVSDTVHAGLGRIPSSFEELRGQRGADGALRAPETKPSALGAAERADGECGTVCLQNISGLGIHLSLVSI